MGSLSSDPRHKTSTKKPLTLSFTMAMWADNLKFVKDILDGKYKKIDDAILEMTANAEELFLGAGRTLELIEPKEIEQLLETIIDEHMPAKEKETLQAECKGKIDGREAALKKYNELKKELKL